MYRRYGEAINAESVMACVIKDYQEYFARATNDQETAMRNNKAGHYGYIPARGLCSIVSTLMHIMRTLKGEDPDGAKNWYERRSSPKFLDAGCGVGNIMLLAGNIGFNAYGLEYNFKTAATAKKLCGGKIVVADIVDYPKYDMYDVIYTYVPIRDGDKRDKFCKVLAHSMKIGAYLIPYGSGGEIFGRSQAFEIATRNDSDCTMATRKVGKYEQEAQPCP